MNIFTNDSTVLASAFNENFSEVVNALSDGSGNLVINNIIVNGTVTSTDTTSDTMVMPTLLNPSITIGSTEPANVTCDITGNVHVTGYIGTDANWSDWDEVLYPITGFCSCAQKVVKWRYTGMTFQMLWDIRGTSNGDSGILFRIPVQPSLDYAANAAYLSTDATAGSYANSYNIPGRVQANQAASPYVTVYAGWGSGQNPHNDKTSYGFIEFPIQAEVVV